VCVCVIERHRLSFTLFHYIFQPINSEVDMGDVHRNLLCVCEFCKNGSSERQSLRRVDGEFLLVLSDFNEIW